MSRNIRLCTHRCAKCWLKKLRILIPLIAMPAHSSGCCSTSVAWSSKTAFRSPSSMKSTPGEIILDFFPVKWTVVISWLLLFDEKNICAGAGNSFDRSCDRKRKCHAVRSPSSMKSTPGEISRVNHRWRCSRLTILWIRIVLIFSKTIIIPAKVVLIIQ